MKSDPDRSRRSRSPPVENTDVLTELIEAVTALGNYFTAARLILTAPPSGSHQLADTLEKALEQYDRGAVVLRRIRAFQVLSDIHPTTETSC